METVTESVPGRKKGLAPQIRKMAILYPELTHSEIARAVGCNPSNVTIVLKTFLGNTSEESLREFQSNKADVYDALQQRLLLSITQEKIDKTKPMEAITGAAILEDKARLVRGQATSINMTAVVDLIEVMRAETGKVIEASRPDAKV